MSQILRFDDIAEYLNIPNETVHSLCIKKALPGNPCRGGWNSTFEKIEKWYLSLTGQQWADLINEGNLDAIATKVKLSDSINLEILSKALLEEQKNRIAVFSDQTFRSDGSVIWKVQFPTNLKAFLNLREVQLNLEKVDTSSETGKLLGSLFGNLSTAYTDELIISKQSVLLSFNSEKILHISIQDPLGQLPQRDREIIRYHLELFLDSILQQIKNIS